MFRISQKIQSSGDLAGGLTPAALLEVVQAMESGLPEEVRGSLGDFGWSRRAHAVDALEGGRPQVRFFSDGLDLKTKMAVENAIRQVLVSQWPSMADVSVFMERKEKAPASSAPRGAPQAPPPQAKKTDQTPVPGGRRGIAGVKRIIAVASGKGGVGKSTVSVNLALALHNQGYRVGILDADIYGPSLPMMLGLSQDPAVNENNKIIPPERHGLKVMSFGFFAPEDSAVIWRGPMVMKALQQFFYDVEWGDLDFLVIDLPPGTGDAQLTLVQSLPISGAVIVTTPQNVALLDAVKGVVMFRKTEVPIVGVVENMSTFECPSCGTESHIFGEGGANRVSVKYNIPVLGHIPLQPEIREAGDSGEPLTTVQGHPLRVRFAEIAERVVRRVTELEKSKNSALN